MSLDKYSGLTFKIPKESDDYKECSEYVVNQVEAIIKDAIDKNRNKIIINTNLKLGLPMKDINKIAGPFVQAWAFEIFYDVFEDENNKYELINVEVGERLNIADIILQFRRIRNNQSSVTGFVDVKATSNDIKNSGKSPNITSFARIRSEYVIDPDYLFIVLSIKHKVHSERDIKQKMMMGIMEIVDFNAYDLKYLSKSDIIYNPALGTGQLQIKDIHHVSIEYRSTWEFCQLLDSKFIKSRRGFEEWLKYAKQYKWIKEET